MTYLFLALLCSSAIGLIFKFSEQRMLNRYFVTSINYLTALIVSGFLLLQSGLLFGPIDINIPRFGSSFVALLQTNTGKLPYADSFTWAIILGIVSGFFYFISFISYQVSVRYNGVALSGMFSRLGILVPMTISIVLWHEIPTVIQIIGITLCLASIILVNFNFKEGEVFSVNTSLIMLFTLFGIAIFFNKIFQKYGLLDVKPLFLFCLFLSAFLVSLTVSLKNIRSITRIEIIVGFLVGIPNMFASFFLIQALEEIKASIVFPVFSAGSIILMSIAAFFLYSERIKRKNGVAIALTSLALVLINL